jgi:hypothetical protein
VAELTTTDVREAFALGAADVLRGQYDCAADFEEWYTAAREDARREATYWALFEASQFIYDELLGAPIEVRIKARALLRAEAAKHERSDAGREE